MFPERMSSRIITAGLKIMVKNNGKDMLSHYGIIPIEVVRTAAKGYLTLMKMENRKLS